MLNIEFLSALSAHSPANLPLAEGATSQLEPRTIEAMGLTVAMVRDPDGYLIELVRHD